MKLLRSQTVEDYAVRHANFTKLSYHQFIQPPDPVAASHPIPPADRPVWHYRRTVSPVEVAAQTL